MAFATRQRRCGQMRGCRPEADPRFTPHVSLFEHDADSRRSFVAVEPSLSDRLRGRLWYESWLREENAGAVRPTV